MGYMSDAEQALLLGMAFNTKTPGAYPYTVLTTDTIVLVDTSVARTINLPNPSTYILKQLSIKDAVGQAATNPITIARFASESIDNLAVNLTLSANFGSVTLISNGTNWFVISGTNGRYPVYPTIAQPLRARYIMRGGSPYGTTISSALATLLDQTANGLNWIQGTAADRPVFGLVGPWQAADFSSSDFMIGNLSPNQWTTLIAAAPAVTIYGCIVLDTLSADNPGAPWQPPGPLGEATGYVGPRFSTSGMYGFLYDTAPQVTPYQTISTGIVYGFRYSYNATTCTIKIAGSEKTVAAGAPGAITGIPRMGLVYTGGGGASLDGRVAEMSIYTSVAMINTSDELAISNYYTNTFGAVSIV